MPNRLQMRSRTSKKGGREEKHEKIIIFSLMAKTINNIFSCHISNVGSGWKLKNSDVGCEAV